MASAQQPSIPVIGFLSSRSPGESAGVVAAFQQGLRETGFVEGQNIVIAFRWAEGHYDRLQEQAADLVRRRVALIAATGGTTPALAAKRATATIPILFISGANPIYEGLVTNFRLPDGNAKGVNVYTS